MLENITTIKTGIAIWAEYKTLSVVIELCLLYMRTYIHTHTYIYIYIYIYIVRIH